MRFIEKLREKHEDKILAKAKIIEEKRLIQEQVRQAEIEVKEKEIQKLLNSSIPKDFVIELCRKVEDKNGRFMYRQYDYFLSDVAITDMGYRDVSNIIKITGDNIGLKAQLEVWSPPFLPSLTHCVLIHPDKYLEEVTTEDEWEGDVGKNAYIPDVCITISNLNNYANRENEKRKREYEQKVLTRQQKEQTIQNQFFK